MAALTCEICGGKLVGKPGGVFECDSCGMEYSTEWAKAKIQEIRGTVQVEGTVEVTGTVKVEGGANKESLLKRGYLLLEDSDWKGADECFDQVLNIAPECAEAYVGRYCAKCRYKRIAEMAEDPRGFQRGTALPGIQDNVSIDPILDYLSNNQKGKAILQYRQQTGASLAEAKAAVEKIESVSRVSAGTSDFEKALRFASPELRAQLEGYQSAALQQTQKIQRQREEERRQEEEARRQEEEAHRLQAEEEARRAEEQQRLLAERRALIRPAASCISITYRNVIAVKSDGTLLWAVEASSDTSAWNQYREAALSWKNISQVVLVGKGNTKTFGVIGVRMDGSLVWAGKNLSFLDEDVWTDLTAMVYTEVDRSRRGYHDYHDVFVGLKRDGHIILHVTDEDKLDWEIDKLREWDNLTKIIGGKNYIAGLKSDGTVVAEGQWGFTQLYQAKRWTGIVDIAACGEDIIGLKEDGIVVVTGKTSSDQKRYSDWTEIAALASSRSDSISIKYDGTVMADGLGSKKSKEQLSAWTDIVAVFGDWTFVGVKADGMVVTTSDKYDVSGWKLFDRIETVEQERKEAQRRFEEEEAQARAQRRAALEAGRTVLQNELANLKGLFSGKRRKEIEARLAAIAKELEE